MQKRKGKALVWLRNDLRTHDHASFHFATQNHESVVAYYSFDPLHYAQTQWGFKKTERFRAQFLIETLKDLQEQLEQLNISLIIEQKDSRRRLRRMVCPIGNNRHLLSKRMDERRTGLRK